MEDDFFPSDPNELVDRLYLLHQEKIAGNDSKNINDEMVAIYDKLYEYSIISETDHLKCLSLWFKNFIFFITFITNSIFFIFI